MKFNEKWEAFIRHAYKCNDFYEQVAKKEHLDIDSIDFMNEWEKVPVITKKMLLENEECIINHEYIASLYEGKLVKAYTSGSTGDYIEIYWRPEDYNRSLFPLWLYRLKEHGVKPEDKLCYFYTTRQCGIDEDWYEYSKNRIGFCKANLNENRLREIYEKIYDFSPRWMLLQPSMAALLCIIQKRYKLPEIESLQYIELTGEMLTEDQRNEIKKCFSCHIANQYGSNEVNSIAYECKSGHLHIMDSNVYVEVLDENNRPVFNKEGEICVTSFSNHAMPMIRYKIGDRGVLRKDGISCNHKGAVLELTKARSNDWIVSEQGTRISPYTLLKVVENINQQTEHGILQFRLIQKSVKQVIVKFVLDDGVIPEEVKRLFMDNLAQEELRQLIYTFEYYDYLPINENTGKLAWFESEV